MTNKTDFKVRVLYCNWKEFEPVEVTIIDPSRSKLYYAYPHGWYVKFKAIMQVGEHNRAFELSIPMKPCLRAFKALPRYAKDSELLKITFEKQYKGILKIKNWEIIKDHGMGNNKRK